MQAVLDTASTDSFSEGRGGSATGTTQFEWTVVLLCTWLMSGAYLDAWAHRHLTKLETFFTPWHAVLYSGMLALLIFLATTALRNQARGSEPDRMLPTGYGLSLVGCALFGFGGVIDMFWHLRFGIEVSLQALISPPHLLLMSALGLIVTGPLRAAWKRPGLRAPWSAVSAANHPAAGCILHRAGRRFLLVSSRPADDARHQLAFQPLAGIDPGVWRDRLLTQLPRRAARTT